LSVTEDVVYVVPKWTDVAGEAPIATIVNPFVFVLPIVA